MVNITRLSTLILVVLQSCMPIVHNKSDFRIAKESNTSNKIDTNGYYYTISNNNNLKYRILFNNGLYREIGQINSKINSKYFIQKCVIQMNDSVSSSIKNFECMINNYEYFFNVNTNFLNSNAKIWNWGRFKVVDNTLIIQYFYNHFGDYYLMEENGIVLNDKTFRIIKTKDHRTNKVQETDLLYKFKKHEINNLKKFYPKGFLSL